ncbi:thioesterase family protein-like protein [Amylocarpus encephaloides]|uniref:Thioesterase family protein-like protein n=1 Tax=Amylocarpus encephaloides TaxID=45428 RepID=A0A9P7YK60_9HELO|nr:thioesterase family protein-like protein [Amylocarpus encephaloides]
MCSDPASRARAMKAVEAIFERYHLISRSQSFNGFDLHTMNNLRLLDASEKGTSTYEFLIDEQYTNLNGVMHGGAAGVIFDMCTTTALGPLARKGYWDFLGGVTRTLGLSYLRAVPVGTKVRLHSEVIQVGKTMAMIRGKMSSLDGKIVYCTCEHHKVAVPTQPAHLDFKVEWDQLWEKDSDVSGALTAKGGKAKL